MADQIEQIAIITGEGTAGFLELAARPGVKPSGKLFKKQILKWGSFIHPSSPGKRIKVDRGFADQLVTNFASGACDIVQFPVVNDANKHVEGPDHNLGEVIDLDYDENGVNAYIDVRKNADDIGRTILGASALMHLDYCVDTETEILTRRGWLRWDEVQVGDQSLAVNPESGLAEWSVIESVFREPRKREMVSLEGRGFSALTTPDHRWLARDRSGKFVWTTTETMGAHHAIPTAAPGAAASEPKYLDALVELVAWFYTEGSFQTSPSGKPVDGQLSQSVRVNPSQAARIEKALIEVAGPPGSNPVGLAGASARWSHPDPGGFQWRYGDRESGVRLFYFGQRLLTELLELAPDKVPSPEFLTSLSQAQLELFIRTSIEADGYRPGQRSGKRLPSARTQRFGQQDLRRVKAFEMACALAGFSVSTSGPYPNGQYDTGVGAYDQKRPMAKDSQVVVSRTEYEGHIWCPTLTHHNWLARRRGKIYFTGNTNTLTGQRMGPTLLHVAATNRPYLTNLAPFSEVIAASADTPDEAAIWTAEKEPQPVLDEDDTQEIEPVQEQQEVQLSEPGGDDMPNTKEDLIAALMEHGIDVAALLEQSEEVAELSALGIGDEEDGLSVRDVAEAVLELSQKNTEQAELIASLAAANEAMEQERAINEVDELIRVGRILPRQRDVMIKLARNDRETFEQLIPDEAIVSLSEDGVTTHESSNTDEVNDEIKRLTDLATAWTKNHK